MLKQMVLVCLVFFKFSGSHNDSYLKDSSSNLYRAMGRKCGNSELKSISNMASSLNISIRFKLRGGSGTEDKSRIDDRHQNPLMSDNLAATDEMIAKNDQNERENFTNSDNEQATNRIRLDLHAIIQMTKAGECLKFQAGEFHFDETVEIDRCLNFSHSKPTLSGEIQAVQEAISSATNHTIQPIAATTVVRIWGYWSFLNASSGQMSNLTTVAKSREANYPTLDILGGPWSFTSCGLRSVGGTAVLVYAEGRASIAGCAIGSLAGFPKAAYGLTATDSSAVSVRDTLFQRCRFAGARFVRRARADVVDCVFDHCVVQGAKNVRAARDAHPPAADAAP